MNAIGSQSVTLPSSLGCDSIATLNLSVNNAVTPTFAAINPVCSGALAPSLPNISNNGIPGTWFPATINNVTTSTYVFTPSLGQCATTAQLTVVVNANPTIVVSSNSPVCSGNSINLSSNGGIDYEWSGPNNYAVVSQNPIRTNSTTLMSGVYTVTVTNTEGCSSTASVNVLVNPRPVVTIGSNSPVCAGNSILLTSGGGTGYSWSGPNTFSNLLQNPTIPSATVSASGNYIVTVTGTGGCTSTSQVLVTVNANPLATAGSNSPICEGVTLNLTSSGGTSYSWNGPNSFTNLTQNPSISSVPIVSAGTYTVTVTGTGSCTSTAQTTVIVNSLPIPSINGDTVLCPGENTTLTASGGVSYVWSNGSLLATNDVSPVVSTTYIVTVTNQAGCSQTTSVFVSRVTNPVISLIDSIIETCSASNGSLQVTVTDGTQPYHYNWNNGGGDVPMIDSLSSSIYTVTVTDDAGCSVFQAIPLSNSPSPTLTIVNIIDDHCFKGIGSATVIATGGTGSYAYSWNTQPEQFNTNATSVVSGTYVAKVNDGNCTDSVEVIVGNIPGPTAEFDSDKDSALVSNSIIRFINESIGGTSYSWNFGDGEQSLQENPLHFYVNSQNYIVTLEVVDDFGCSDTASHVISIFDDIYILIPNTFTPDGDGLNDVFKPVGVGYSLNGYELNVYNRWGQLVFHTNDINEGWDGTVKGELVTFKSVFVYKIEVCGLLGKAYIYTGHITVLAY
jgi:gliding motility-associated-like protein